MYAYLLIPSRALTFTVWYILHVLCSVWCVNCNTIQNKEFGYNTSLLGIRLTRHRDAKLGSFCCCKTSGFWPWGRLPHRPLDSYNPIYPSFEPAHKAILQNSYPGFIPHGIQWGKREIFHGDSIGFVVKYYTGTAFLQDRRSQMGGYTITFEVADSVCGKCRHDGRRWLVSTPAAS